MDHARWVPKASMAHAQSSVGGRAVPATGGRGTPTARSAERCRASPRARSFPGSPGSWRQTADPVVEAGLHEDQSDRLLTTLSTHTVSRPARSAPWCRPVAHPSTPGRGSAPARAGVGVYPVSPHIHVVGLGEATEGLVKGLMAVGGVVGVCRFSRSPARISGSAELLSECDEACAAVRAMHPRCHRAGNGSCSAGSGTRLTARSRSGRPAFWPRRTGPLRSPSRGFVGRGA
jgi:hypothetical protein